MGSSFMIISLGYLIIVFILFMINKLAFKYNHSSNSGWYIKSKQSSKMIHDRIRHHNENYNKNKQYAEKYRNKEI